MSKGTASKTCAATKKSDSTPCNNPPKGGSEYCGVHQSEVKPINWQSDVEKMKVFDNLTPKEIEISKIWLDPMNPRIQNKQEVVDSQIPSSDIQNHCRDQIINSKGLGIEDLEEKFLTLGFRTAGDMIYVKKLEGIDGYLTLEGSRRICCAKEVITDISKGLYKYKSDAWKETFTKAHCLVYEGDNPKVNSILQGHRHVGGGVSLGWIPIRRAEYYLGIRNDATSSGAPKPTAHEIAQQEGEKDPSVVRNLLRSLDAMRSANGMLSKTKQFEDPDGFGWFQEAILPGSPGLKKYLGWDSKKGIFTEEANVKNLANMINKAKPQIGGQIAFRDNSKNLFDKDGTPSSQWEKMVDDPTYSLDDAIASVQAEKAAANLQKKIEKDSAVGWVKRLKKSTADINKPPLVGKGGFYSVQQKTLDNTITELEDLATSANQISSLLKKIGKSSSPTKICAATTKKDNTPCNNKAKDGTEYCGKHKEWKPPSKET